MQANSADNMSSAINSMRTSSSSPLPPRIESKNSDNPAVSKFSFRWEVDDLDLSDNKIFNMIESPVFSCGTSEHKLDWCVGFYSLDKKNDNTCLSFRLLIVSRNKTEVAAKFSFSMLDGENKEAIDAEINVNEEDWGPNKFIFQDFVLNKTSAFEVDDLLMLFCEVNLMTQSNNNFMQINSTDNSFIYNFGDLFKEHRSSDVTLSTGDEEFHVHQTILEKESSVFKAMFEHENKEKITKRVEIIDVDKEVVRLILLFIYTNKIDVKMLEKHCCGVLMATDKYLMDCLKELCAEQMEKILTIENCVEFLAYADMTNAYQLKYRAFNHITKYAYQVIETEGWEKILRTMPHLISSTFNFTVD